MTRLTGRRPLADGGQATILTAAERSLERTLPPLGDVNAP
jgi:hypothetical protein